MDRGLKTELEKIALTVRGLTIDAIEKANSGHPGLPMGCAEIGAYLYGNLLVHYPQDPSWINRDRFILSAGHGSMLLYSLLHLSGFLIKLEDLQEFRQLHSITPGHPEYNLEAGIEATTGPLGQGIGNSVGLSLGYKILQKKFNTEDFSLFTNKIYCLAGDGCMMEGAASEASSLAGHWQLDNLIVIYDANNVSLDGPLSESYSENTKERYLAYGWDVYEIDGHNFEELESTFATIHQGQSKPVLIIAYTIIGKGSPHKSGSHKVHGAPLGQEELDATKKALDLPQTPFYVPDEVYDFFQKKQQEQKKSYEEWQSLFEQWQKKHPQLFAEFVQMKEKKFSKEIEKTIYEMDIASPIAGRKASQKVLEELTKKLPDLYGGSADLSSSDMTFLEEFPVISAHHFSGRNIKYGVREFAMATISNGLFLTGMITPFCGTFLVFSDYMRNAIRLAALSSYHVIYQFTHDSIFLGEDGPTHQPIEHLASLRAIPRLQVIRPADANEVKGAWIAALHYLGPSAIILSRQSLPTFSETKIPYEEGVGKGAYVVKGEENPDIMLIATGSELQLAFKVTEELENKGKKVEVISFPSWEIFEQQTEEYKEKILGKKAPKVVIEAASSQGWHKYIGKEGITISVDTFGSSAPIKEMKKEYRFTVEGILERMVSLTNGG